MTFVDPASAWIGPDVTVGADTVIHPNVYLEGRTRIGSGCEIHAGVRIVDSTLDDGVVVNNYCVITESHVRAGARIGPFAHIRPQSDVGEGAHVGNFTELKKTTLGKGSKANHLSYLGDATIGEKREHRRRHDHLQLRRRAQAPDRHRGRRVHRQRQRSSSRRSASARARTSPPDRRSSRTCRRARSASRAASR